MERAIERGEIAKDADIDMVCEIIVSSIHYRTTTQGKNFDKSYYATMIDNILLPALKKK